MSDYDDGYIYQDDHWPAPDAVGWLAVEVCRMVKLGDITPSMAITILEYHCGWDREDAVWALREVTS